MDSAIGGASANRDHGPRAGCEAVDPLACCDGLAGSSVGAERCPVTFLLVVFVGDRALDNQNEWIHSTSGCQVEATQEFVTVFKRKKWVVEVHFGNPRHPTQHDVFNTRLRCSRHSDGVAVATKPRCDP